MTDDNVSNLPQNVVFDLDAAERPAEDIKEPFTFKWQDRVIEMTDPAELDWRDLVTMDDPTGFIRLSLSDEDRKWLLGQGFESWRFGKLLEAYSVHFGLEDKIRQARQQQKLAGV